MLPNFLIIGAMKSGTTTLYHLLEGHPQIFMSKVKELHFFASDNEWSRGIEWYKTFFAGSDNAKAVGEGSTSYTKYPSHQNCASRIASILPNVRIIYIMRNPIQRTWSHYWHSVRNDGERRSPDEAITQDSHYVNVSRYHMQISKYLNFFDKKEMLLLLLDDLREKPLSLLGQVFEFLRVDSTYTPPNAEVVKNVARQSEIDGSLLANVRNIPGVEDIASLIPSRIKQTLKPFIKKRVKKPEEIPDRIRDFLRNILEEDIIKLERFMNRDLSYWLL